MQQFPQQQNVPTMNSPWVCNQCIPKILNPTISQVPVRNDSLNLVLNLVVENDVWWRDYINPAAIMIRLQERDMEPWT